MSHVQEMVIFLAQQLVEENEPSAGDSNFDFRNYMCPATNCRVYVTRLWTHTMRAFYK